MCLCNKSELYLSRSTRLSSFEYSVSSSFLTPGLSSLLSNKSPSFLFRGSLLCSLLVSLYLILYLFLSLCPTACFGARSPLTALSHCFNVNRMLCFSASLSSPSRANVQVCLSSWRGFSFNSSLLAQPQRTNPRVSPILKTLAESVQLAHR